MDQGCLKLFRRILQSQVFAHQTGLKIWVWCLCKATFKERFVPLKIGKGEITVKLLPGQFIFGRFKAEEELGIDGSTIYKWIQKFATPEYDMIQIESNNQYSIITLCNWEQYQIDEKKKVTTEEQPKNNHVTTEEQPKNTNNNDNNVNNDLINTWRENFESYLSYCKKGYKDFFDDPELVKTQERLNPGVNIKLTIEKGYTNYWSTEAGWKKKKAGKSKDIDWKRTIINSIEFNKVYDRSISKI